MKKCSFNGPAGEVRVKDPLAVKLVESSPVLTILTFLFVLWGGYYLYLADQTSFLGRHLTPAHRKLEKNCLACHVPFVGATDEACQSAECHPKISTNTIHNTRNQRCIECHPEHTDGLIPPDAVPSKQCVECHDRLKADPNSQFFPAKWNQRTTTNVPRAVFRHRLHQYPPHYKCYQCHCTGKGTLNTPMDQLFVMKSCMECHKPENCKVCHAYHQKREPKPRVRTCIKEEFVSELQYKTLECTPYKGREPGFNNLTVCETGKSAAYQPDAAEGNTTGPAAPVPAAPAFGATAAPSGAIP